MNQVAPGRGWALALTVALGCSGPLELRGAEALGILDYPTVPETSGMAVSLRHPDHLWLINDSGNAAELIALDQGAQRYLRIAVDGADNRDWEDLERFDQGGQSWLAIADIGDNRARRAAVQVHLLLEPDVLAPASAPVLQTLELTYPDGPRDAESLAVDSATRHVYLLSKREQPPVLYRAPLPAEDFRGIREVTLTRLGPVTSIPEAGEKAQGGVRRHAAQPTAMTYLPQQRLVALLTYGESYTARLDESGDWLAALNGQLCPLGMPPLAQSEAIAADAQGRILVTSEGRRAPLLRLTPACR